MSAPEIQPFAKTPGSSINFGASVPNVNIEKLGGKTAVLS